MASVARPLHAEGRSQPFPPIRLPVGGAGSPRMLGGVLFFTVAVGCVTANSSLAQAPGGAKTAAPVPRVVRVTPSEATGAVEVSVAINPTNPDHMIAASIARMKGHPSVTNYAYVTTDAGRTWRMVPRDNPHKVTQGDDVVTFTPDGRAIHAFISFAGIRLTPP